MAEFCQLRRDRDVWSAWGHLCEASSPGHICHHSEGSRREEGICKRRARWEEARLRLPVPRLGRPVRRPHPRINTPLSSETALIRPEGAPTGTRSGAWQLKRRSESSWPGWP